MLVYCVLLLCLGIEALALILAAAEQLFIWLIEAGRLLTACFCFYLGDLLFNMDRRL